MLKDKDRQMPGWARRNRLCSHRRGKILVFTFVSLVVLMGNFQAFLLFKANKEIVAFVGSYETDDTPRQQDQKNKDRAETRRKQLVEGESHHIDFNRSPLVGNANPMMNTLDNLQKKFDGDTQNETEAPQDESVAKKIDEDSHDTKNDTNKQKIVQGGIETVGRGTLEEKFYSYHRQQVLSLVNLSSAIIWNPRAKPEKFMPLYEAVGDVYLVDTPEKMANPDLAASPFIKFKNICYAAQAFNRHRSQKGAGPLPHVLFHFMHENWGGFSERIPGRTTSWVKNLTKEWEDYGCTKESIFEYLDHPDTRAAFTMQFQSMYHPKVYSLPLGFLEPARTLQRLLNELNQMTPSPPVKRSQLLMINHQNRKNLRDVTKTIENFGGKIQNTYGKSLDAYYHELSHSKFILSPSGMAVDCYRNYEAITIGTIPVIETLNRTDRWFEIFDDLPVAFIDHYDNLTPEFLEIEYQKIISNAGDHKYAKLTKQYWVDFIRSHVADALLGDQQSSKMGNKTKNMAT